MGDSSVFAGVQGQHLRHPHHQVQACLMKCKIASLNANSPPAERGIRRKKSKFISKKSFPCKYLDCKAEFPTRFNLRRHVMLQHLKTRSHMCPKCSKCFALEGNFDEHHRVHVDTHSPQQSPKKEVFEESYTSMDSDQLPLFFVESGDEESLLRYYVKNTELPEFCKSGMLCVPQGFHLGNLN